MKLEISKEELRNFLLHATDEQLAEMIEFIHPVDILEVIHEYKEDEDVIMKRLPSEILAEIVDEEEDEEKYGLLSHFSDTEQMSSSRKCPPMKLPTWFPFWMRRNRKMSKQDER